MGFPSLHENILERLNDALASLLRDEERGVRSRSIAEEEARLSVIRKVQQQIGSLLEEHLDIATTPGIELTDKVRDQESAIAALRIAVENAQTQLADEQLRTRAALDLIVQRDAKIDELQQENNRLEMKVAFLNVRENGGRSSPVRSRR